MCQNSRAVTFCFNSKIQWQMFLLFYMLVPFRRAPTWRLHTKLYKFGWNSFPNHAGMRLFFYGYDFCSMQTPNRQRLYFHDTKLPNAWSAGRVITSEFPTTCLDIFKQISLENVDPRLPFVPLIGTRLVHTIHSNLNKIWNTLHVSRNLWVGACTSAIFLSRRFYRPIYF